MTASERRNQHAAVVYNPVKVDLAKLRASVAAAEQSAGWGETQWFETSKDDVGQAATKQALDGGASMVVSAGGDGTVRAVAEALRDSGVRMAIVPSGTGNLLARNLDLPLGSIDAATAIAFSGEDKSIDLGVASITTEAGAVEEHVFLVMAGVGLDAQMIAHTRDDLKKQVGWLAYVDGVARALPKARPFRIRYSVAGRTDRPAQVSAILVANCGLLPGNIQFLPHARLDDGILDIAVLQPKGVLGWLTIWRRVTWENGVLRRSAVGRRMIAATESSNERVMTTLRGPDIRIALEHPQDFELDGDEFGLVQKVRLHADAGALIVRVPA
ncbi:diacylglycerol kinase [Cryobacterium levicorallinum]|uniref:Diacylglycerol kinase n=1 Tax=Cryobacterium levicorallinum TaxID=995038 RepID=A0A1I3DXS8_9MICO|nr:diacylglycerol kinase family protein [Cryobacterium levicorallinum]TFB83977.1 diacylglycerol kinase [Cryobacterium levicorallinum]GEP28652.1 diacylglycerol kinase [Cryobacterium levicorallinum]SFH91398.1 Diacylglycerol kinase family enzyme [Cryobacterium levicorallinum]